MNMKFIEFCYQRPAIPPIMSDCLSFMFRDVLLNNMHINRQFWPKKGADVSSFYLQDLRRHVMSSDVRIFSKKTIYGK